MKKVEEIVAIIRGIDFRYSGGIDYDYDRVEAYDHDERCANDYCRCTTLENFVINSVDATLFVRTIKEYLDIDSDNDFFTNDIVKVCESLRTEDFEFNTTGGYYGDEFDSIKLENYDVINKIANIFSIKAYRKEKLKQINLSTEDIGVVEEDYVLDEYVKKILTDEYGYVLDSLKGSKFKIVEIETKDVIFPQREYNEFVKSQNLSSYKNRKGICGLVKIVNGKYHVIDGYHRINANKNISKINVILAYK